VLVHHDRPGEGQALPGAPAHLLGREELIEDLVRRDRSSSAALVVSDFVNGLHNQLDLAAIVM
jgi:hypothetical protein